VHAVLAVAVLAAPSRAQPVPPAAPHARVGVIVDLAANISPDRATELGAALADALQRELDVDAIGGADVTRRLPTDGVPEGCVAEPRCVADLAARLDATELLFLAIVQVGPTVQVDSTWTSLRTSATIARPRIAVPADARAGEVFAAAARRLLPDAPVRAIALAPPVLTLPPAPTRHLTTPTWIAGGAALAALAGGAAFGLVARGTYQRCDRDPASCDAADRHGITVRAAAADALFAGALIGAGTAAFFYLRSAGREHRPAQAWQLVPTRHGAFAELHVEF
jgi:hypothetical protein